MCGIVGFKTTEHYRELKDDLIEAANLLSHRGPDDSGLFFDPKSGVGFAHRRLSIIDLSAAGHQPMASDNGKILITYNGEIYNFREIRKTLERNGHQFKSRSDTEVVLKAYQHWGTDCLQEFIGMFAFALWDSHKNSLFIARDRLGIKPVYYYHVPGLLLFASELKGLMAFKCFLKDIDVDSIPLFLHYQYIPAPKTIFKNTYKLLPGHFLIHNDDQVTLHKYWKYPDETSFKSNAELNEEEQIAHLDTLLTQAVSDRLVSDVPLGALLSGGIDSSLVVALMQKINVSPTRTFSIGFEERGYNEAPWAAKIAGHLGTNHTEFYVTPKEAIETLPQLPEIYDEPFADSSAIPTFLVSRLTRSQVTVALSGDGGDEQFCGYVRYWTTRAMENSFARFPNPIGKMLATILGSIPYQFAERGYSSFYRFLPQHLRVANFADKWQKLIQLLDKKQISELYRMTICLWPKEELDRLLGQILPESRFEETFRKTEGWPLLARLMHVDQMTYLPDAMLTKVDRASMAVSLEVRVPLLDHRVIEYTAGLPDNFKFRNGGGKYLLKKLLERYVPKALFERPKMGFGVPIDTWLQSDLKDMLLDYLSVERIKAEGLFDHRTVEQKITEHLSGRANHQYRLWALLMWEMWRERWI